MEYYNLLEIPIDATSDEIRKAYFEAAKMYHPDVNTTPAEQDIFLKIQNAYETLVNADRRKIYDSRIPEDARPQKQIQVNAFYSRSTIPVIDDNQVFYLLLDIFPTSQRNPDLLPPVNICLVLDKSTSMQGPLLDKIKSESANLLKLLRDDDTISVVAFSDFAEIIIPPTKIANIHTSVAKLQSVHASGATEIFNGLSKGIEILRNIPHTNQVKQLILLTDGHTYGDEDKCIELMREAAEEGITFQAIGIGESWNDQFLDDLSKVSSGETRFVSSAQEMYESLVDKIKASGILFAKGVKIGMEVSPLAELSYAFRLSPDLSPLEIDKQIQLGNLYVGKHLRVLLEFQVPPIKTDITELRIIHGTLKFQIPSNAIKVTRMFFDLRKPVVKDYKKDVPPAAIVDALSNLTLYRIQEKARKEAKAGDISGATRHLHYVATHLLAQGDRKLAHTVLEEAEHLQTEKSFSELGEKRMKYGTRSLLLLPEPKAESEKNDYLP